MSNEKKVYKDADGNELNGDDLKAYRKQMLLEALEADKKIDAIKAEMESKLKDALLARSSTLGKLEATDVKKFKHPDGYTLTISQKKNTKNGVPGIFFLRGKPQAVKENEDVFDMDEE